MVTFEKERKRMKMKHVGVAVFAASLLVAGTTFARDYSTEFREGVNQRVTRQELERQYPARVSPRLDRATKSADAIVGWYDKGHNYHAQKMGQRFTPKERFEIEQRMRMRGRALQSY